MRQRVGQPSGDRVIMRSMMTTLVLLVAAFADAQDGSSSIFDGQTLNGWTTLDGQPVTQGWEVVDGTIHLSASQERSGHIITARDVGNFVLDFEFKIAPRGNSGIKYRVQDINGNMLGCEYQIYDDAHPDKPVPPKSSTGSLYALYEPIADKPLNPAGEFNSARIVVQDHVIEHWLNGRLLLRVIVGSAQWYCRIADSKFHDDPGFGLNRFGRIMLTDHGSEVWYRNIKFVELPTDPAPAALQLASSAACLSTYSITGVSCGIPLVCSRVNCRPVDTCTVSASHVSRRHHVVRRCRWSRR